MKTLFATCLFVLAAPVALASTAPVSDTTTEAAADADAQFTAIHEKEWSWRQREYGWSRDDADFSRRARLPSVDAASQQARLAVWQDVLKQLDAIDPQTLSPAQRVNYQVYRPQVENLAADVRLRGYEMPFNSDSSFWSNLGFMARGQFRNVDDYRAYIGKLNDVPRHFEQHIVNMRAGLARGFSVPRAVLDGREVSIATVAQEKDIEKLTLWLPFAQMPATIPAEQQAALRKDAREALSTRVQPAFTALLAFFHEEYVPGARTTLAAETLPDGKAYYRQQIREYTTLDLSPQEIHDIGLKEVARIRAEMDGVIAQSGFEGDFDAFLHFLRTDPQFYAKTPQELLHHAAWIAKRVDGVIGRFFDPVPRGRFTIIPVPDDIAPFWTSGRGGMGTYWLNTYDLPSRPLYNLPALTLHEAAPGHAFQAALAREQEEQPGFRRNSYISAYGEGWGLYVEKLGKEMGIYETPYQDFGRLSYEMWRAARLVIDTGVHHLGWSRDQALAYLRDHTALSEHEVTTEVDRYISWPGQALSYKLGEIAIWKLRAEAEQALGADFDIRAFHNTVLSQGSVPLPVLEAQVRDYIRDAAGKARAKKDAEQKDTAT